MNRERILAVLSLALLMVRLIGVKHLALAWVVLSSGSCEYWFFAVTRALSSLRSEQIFKRIVTYLNSRTITGSVLEWEPAWKPASTLRSEVGQMGTIRIIKITIAVIGLIVMIAGFLIGTRWELKETLVYDDKGNMSGITTLKYYPSAELGLIITLVGGLLALLAVLISLEENVLEEPVVTRK